MKLDATIFLFTFLSWNRFRWLRTSCCVWRIRCLDVGVVTSNFKFCQIWNLLKCTRCYGGGQVCSRVKICLDVCHTQIEISIGFVVCVLIAMYVLSLTLPFCIAICFRMCEDAVYILQPKPTPCQNKILILKRSWSNKILTKLPSNTHYIFKPSNQINFRIILEVTYLYLYHQTKVRI